MIFIIFIILIIFKVGNAVQLYATCGPAVYGILRNLEVCLDADISKRIVGGNPIQVKADSKPDNFDMGYT